MKSLNDKSGIGVGKIVAVLLGLFAAICICVIAMLIIPIFVLNGNIGPETMQMSAVITLSVAAFTGAVISGLIVSERKTVVSTISCVILFTILICIGVMFFELNYETIINGIIGCAVGTVCSVLFVNRKKRKKFKHKKRSR